MSRHWIWPVSAKNWEILSRTRVWATYSRSATRKVNPRDKVIFYVVGTGELRNSYTIKNQWYENNELIWAEEKPKRAKIYPYQCNLKLHMQGHAVYADLASKLDFVENKLCPKVYVMGTHGGPANFQRPMSKKDFDHIIEAFRTIRHNEDAKSS